MSNEHSKEPWNVANVSGVYIGGKYRIEYQNFGAHHVAYTETEANARRIVACINWLEGVTERQMERDISAVRLMEEASKARKQRDALLGAAKLGERLLMQLTAEAKRLGLHEPSLKEGRDKLRAAIAAVESGKVPS